MVIDYDRIYKDAVKIVTSLVNGAMAGGCFPDVKQLLSDTYTALKEVAEQAVADENGSYQPAQNKDDEFDL